MQGMRPFLDAEKDCKKKTKPKKQTKQPKKHKANKTPKL